MIRKRKFPQRRKGVELYFIFADFFAPLRLCGNLISSSYLKLNRYPKSDRQPTIVFISL